MHGTPALAADFAHLPYVDPSAPKGGRIAYGFVGTFESLNPFIVRGNAPRGIADAIIGNNVFETLLVRSAAEPFTLYGLIAAAVETADDRSWIAFRAHPEARFSDGSPLTIDDVIFSVELLGTKGRPIYRDRFRRIVATERLGSDGVRFRFEGGADRELAMLIGLMPVLSKAKVDPETFDQSSLTPLLGSGPYTIAEVRPGQRLGLARNPDYWAKDLPIKRGFDNFDEIRIEYFRDGNSLFEAFKKGDVDVHFETDAGRWAEGYDFPAARAGAVVRDSFVSGIPKGMNAFVFNTRRKPFDDPRVREAFTYLFDFEWVNRNLYFGAYTRTSSFFEASGLSAVGQPATDAERALLAPFGDAVLPEVMDGSYRPPGSDGSGRDRANLRKALDLLQSAGFRLAGRSLLGPDGQPFSFEFLVNAREQERLAIAFRPMLQRLGIDMQVRSVDSTQYWDRQKQYDFDMLQMLWTASLSPGREQLNRWSSEAADVDGTFNFAGVKNPAVDAMIDALLAATSREDFEAAVRALDRVLISGRYVIPLFHLAEDRIAHWVRVTGPPPQQPSGFQTPTWWFDPDAPKP
ncbi:ABC transporter substrate-binding protein [Methylobrevis sp. L22]|uniref:ABC transporter substrate-binding protein n=2 Tax=Methylobrevis albus TaxID=2793297 RepID=A0A931I538_9HYPH|nr:ABC transporter substrate-binding protein [Methylobrevis albus]